MGTSHAVTLRIRLRPLRLVFLVEPGNQAMLRRAIQLNTAIWGGTFNGIVQGYRRLPSELKDWPITSAKDYVSGRVNAFTPDYVVAMQPELTDSLVGWPESRVIGPTDVFDAQQEDPVGYGVDARWIYYDVYEREFKFERRHPAEVGLPQLEERQLSLLSAAIFGEFPRDASDAFETQYRDLFDPDDLTVAPNSYFDAVDPSSSNPRRLGSDSLEVSRRGWMRDPVLFFMDGTSTRDIIDFWNLRALGWRVIGIPNLWSEEIRERCAEFVKALYRPMNRNPELKHHATVVRARGVSDEEAKDFTRSIHKPAPDSLSYQHWIPRYWYGWGRKADHVIRPEVSAETRQTELELKGDALAFSSLAPGFRVGLGRGSPRWVNVIEIRHYSSDTRFASVLPEMREGLEAVIRPFSLDEVWSSPEGVILSCQHSANRSHRWEIPDARRLMRAWMEQREFDFETSGAGRVAHEVMRKLGRWGIRLIAEREVVQLLNRMAHGEVEIELGPGEEAGKRRASSPAVSHHELLGLLKRTSPSDKHAEGKLERLVRQDVVRVGLRLRCTQCGQRNWYQLGAIKDRLACERCLRTFAFPSATPPRHNWYYRAIGPFATENYAQGSYAVALAYRALTFGTRAEATFVPSFVLRSPTERLEADFALWWRESWPVEKEPLLVFGECKSFGCRFTSTDLNRMKRLARLFPGSVLAFCTLRDELDKDERQAIGRLAVAGRETFKPGKSRNPVIVLTGRELFGDAIPTCWDDVGEDFGLASRAQRVGGLREVADITQQIYLGLNSYAEWQVEQRN